MYRQGLRMKTAEIFDRRVFMLIDIGRFERSFEAWARSFGAPMDRDVVAIDGKTIRGSFDRVASWGRFTSLARGLAIAGWCLASVRSATSPTRAARSRNCSRCSTLRGRSSPWMRWAASGRSPPGFSREGRIIWWCSKPTKERISSLSKSFAQRLVSAARPATGRPMTNSMMATAAWSGAACSSARTQGASLNGRMG